MRAAWFALALSSALALALGTTGCTPAHPCASSLTKGPWVERVDETHATVIWCEQAENPGEAHQRRAAARLKARWHALDTGHYPMLTMPEELTRLIVSG